ncbi:MAG: hypothetical protein LBG66_01930 [Gallionellaceae bacterium]|jgi:cell wall-associated NlpC family hydrolase|nr:hypothetical protein [Gallionellaceae bacterium]
MTPRLRGRAWLVAAALALFLPSAAPLAPVRPLFVFVPPAEAQAGDLIFRQGTEAVSGAVMLADGGGYSHVGMLAGEPGHWLVVHATPSEVPGRPDAVVVDTLEFFTAPERSNLQTVYHVQADDKLHQQAVINAQAQIGRPFRMADPQGIYCTQLVSQAWRDAGLDLQVKPTHLHLPLIEGDYLLPGDLRVSPHLRKL